MFVEKHIKNAFVDLITVLSLNRLVKNVTSEILFTVLSLKANEQHR